jgi:hypothetical protein
VIDLHSIQSNGPRLTRMLFQEISVATTVRVVCSAYLYSCLILMSLSYVGYLLILHAEKSPKHSHWLG